MPTVTSARPPGASEVSPPGAAACGAQAARTSAAVATAERSVHVEFYIAALDATTEPFFDALRDAVARGVTVRFLYDHLGSRKYPGHTRMNERLTADGVEWHRMMPIDPLRGRWRRPDLRNHRKLVVVDGRTVASGRHADLLERTDYRELVLR